MKFISISDELHSALKALAGIDGVPMRAFLEGYCTPIIGRAEAVRAVAIAGAMGRAMCGDDGRNGHGDESRSEEIVGVGDPVDLGKPPEAGGGGQGGVGEAPATQDDRDPLGAIPPQDSGRQAGDAGPCAAPGALPEAAPAGPRQEGVACLQPAEGTQG